MKRITAAITAAAMLAAGCGLCASGGQTSGGQTSGGQAGSVSMEAGKPQEVSYAYNDYEQWAKLLEENQISEEFAAGMEAFSFKTGSQILSGEGGNAAYSPLSLYYAIALAGCGAEGQTEKEVLAFLGMEDKKELALQCQKLYQGYYYQQQMDDARNKQWGEDSLAVGGTKEDKIRIGNSLWISDELSVNREYQTLAAQQFFAPTYVVDFHQEETGKKMGEWISRQTEGVLSPQLSPGKETLATIINTLYFYGSWSDAFSESLTKEDEFTGEDGVKRKCLFMNQTDRQGSFMKGDGYTTSFLSTNNGCRMFFLLPDKGRNAAEFLASPELLEKGLTEPEGGWTFGEVYWKVPQFAFGTDMSLADTLKAMGLERMFGPEGEFGGISSQPLKITNVIQQTHIGIDENGVEGAAYTKLDVALGALLDEEEKPYAEMILDRPFLFGIQDLDGVWLFLGICRNP